MFNVKKKFKVFFEIKFTHSKIAHGFLDFFSFSHILQSSSSIRNEQSEAFSAILL